MATDKAKYIEKIKQLATELNKALQFYNDGIFNEKDVFKHAFSIGYQLEELGQKGAKE